MDQGAFKETEEAITLHGLGFLQLKLAANTRLHVWHPDLPRRRCFEHSSIHDHRFGFVSRVLVGVQINHVYRHASADRITGTHMSYLHEGERTKFGNRPWMPHGALIITPLYVETTYAGAEYSMAPYVFHSTHPGGDGRVATLMTKTAEHGLSAHSLCEINRMPDVDFDRKQWPADRLWAVIRDVLGDQAVAA